MLVLKSRKWEPFGVAFAPDGKALAVAGMTPGGVDLWPLPGGGEPVRWLPDSDITAHPQFSPDGAFLHCECRTHGHPVRVMKTGATVAPVPDNAGVTASALSADGKWLVVSRVRETGKRKPNDRLTERVGFARAKDGTLTEKWRTGDGTTERHTYLLACLPDKRFVAAEEVPSGDTSMDGTALVLCDLSSGKEIARGPAEHLELNRQLAVADGFVIGVARYRLQVFDAATMKQVAEIVNPTGKKAYTGVAVTPDGKYLLASSTTGLVRAYSVGDWREVKAWDWQVGPLTCVAVSADGTLAAAASQKGPVVVWDVDP